MVFGLSLVEKTGSVLVAVRKLGWVVKRYDLGTIYRTILPRGGSIEESIELTKKALRYFMGPKRKRDNNSRTQYAIIFNFLDDLKDLKRVGRERENLEYPIEKEIKTAIRKVHAAADKHGWKSAMRRKYWDK